MKTLIFLVGVSVASATQAAPIYCYVHAEKDTGRPALFTQPFSASDQEWQELERDFFADTTVTFKAWKEFVQGKGYTNEAHCRELNPGEKVEDDISAIDDGYQMIAWTPLKGGATPAEEKKELDVNGRYVYFQRSSKDGFGAVDIDIYEEHAVSCGKTPVDHIHIEQGKVNLYKCDTAKVGTAGGLCFRAQYEKPGLNPLQQMVGCTKLMPKPTVL